MAKERFTEDLLKSKGYMPDAEGNYSTKLQAAITKVIKTEVPGSTYRGKRENKYGRSAAADRTYNGKIYDSTLEMNYRKHLDLLFMAGEAIKIEEQVQYVLTVNGDKICSYRLDFRVTYKDQRIEHIDTKGFLTANYKLKKKLFEALYKPLKIKEVFTGDF